MATVRSVNVGLPREVAWRGKIVRTAIWKDPVQGRVFAGKLNLAGDGQADLVGHGGEHRAIMVYQIESYHYWKTTLGIDDEPYGQFGENLTVDGLSDAETCIGDQYRIGGAIVEVTQPRVSCFKIGLRLNRPVMPALLVAHHRPGFYCRVLQEGDIGAGDVIEKISAGPQSVTVAEIDALLYTADHPVDLLQRALRISALSAGWRSSLEALLAAATAGQAGNAGLTPNPGEEPLWRGFKTMKIEAITPESDDVRSLVLVSAIGSPLPPALPGQYMVLRLNGGPEHAVRSYSIIDSAEGRYEIAVKRERAGSVSDYIHTGLKVGDAVQGSAPRGSFLLQDNCLPNVFISAGIGLTPLLSMLKSASAEPDRALYWFYGSRDRAHHPFSARVRSIVAELAHGHSCIAYSRPEPALSERNDYDIAGRLDVDILRRRGTPVEANYYLCGPAGFMDAMIVGLQACGVDPNHIHSEAFGAYPANAQNEPAVRPHPPIAGGEGPMVTFTRSSLTVRWGSAFHSLLELAEACSIPVRWSCRAGVCQTCESGLMEGTVTYDPEPLDPPVEGRVFLCCSAPASDISLEL